MIPERKSALQRLARRSEYRKRESALAIAFTAMRLVESRERLSRESRSPRRVRRAPAPGAAR